jgi:hypothetical protein
VKPVQPSHRAADERLSERTAGIDVSGRKDEGRTHRMKIHSRFLVSGLLGLLTVAIAAGCGGQDRTAGLDAASAAKTAVKGRKASPTGVTLSVAPDPVTLNGQVTVR